VDTVFLVSFLTRQGDLCDAFAIQVELLHRPVVLQSVRKVLGALHVSAVLLPGMGTSHHVAIDMHAWSDHLSHHRESLQMRHCHHRDQHVLGAVAILLQECSFAS
jgi:hypothetical protein